MSTESDLNWYMTAENRPTVRAEMDGVPLRQRMVLTASPLAMFRAARARILNLPDELRQ